MRAYWPAHPAQPSFFKLRRQHLFEIMKPITVLRHGSTTPHSTARTEGHGVIASVPESKSGGQVCVGCCQVPAALRGRWISNLMTFFICKDSRERTGTRNRSVRVQSSNTSLRRLRPQVVQPKAKCPPNSIGLVRLLRPAPPPDVMCLCRPFGPTSLWLSLEREE